MKRRLLLPLCLAVFTCAQPALAAPEPKLGKTALVEAVSGTVKVKEKGESKFAKLGKKPKLVALGSIVDAKKGKVRVKAKGKGRGLDDGTFYKGDFEIRQDKQEGITDLVLQGEIGGGGCPVIKTGNARGGGIVPRLYGESSDSFRILGWFADSEVEEDKTKWMTEDLCDSTRTVVESGGVQAAAGPVLIQSVDEGATIDHYCDYDGIAPVSGVFCQSLTHAPDLGVWGAGVVNQGDATSYELCVTNPAGQENCKAYPFSEPSGIQSLRTSTVSCIADGGPGAYSLRWVINGTQLGPTRRFTINTPPGQDCIQNP